MLAVLKRLFSSLWSVSTATEPSSKPESLQVDKNNVDNDEDVNSREHPQNVRDQGNQQGPKRVTITELSGHDVSDKLVPFDESLLEKARTQWQFGDWETLAGITIEELQHQPDRGRLALLVAAGHQQLGNIEETRRMVRLADEWGCDRMLIKRALVSGVYNTLGCVSALAGRSSQAERHFESALQIGLPGSDTRLLAPVRTRQQLESLSLNVASDKQISSLSIFEHLETKKKYISLQDLPILPRFLAFN